MSGTSPARAARWAAAGPAAIAIPVVVGLEVVPRMVGGAAGSGILEPPTVHSVAVATVLGCLAWGAWHHSVPAEASNAAVPREARRATWAAALAVAAVVVLLYFPPFLARYAAYGEEDYFLSALQRIAVGQRPYVDFEFLYGPLLIFPLAWWVDAFGFSLQSYYWFLALVDGATYAIGFVVLSRLVPDRRRFVVFGLMVVLLFNDNLGIAGLTVRRLLPVVALFWYALRGSTWPGRVAVAALVGLQTLISVEYAAACLIGLGALGLVESVAARRARELALAIATGGLGLAIAGCLAVLIMGSDVFDWLAATWRLVTLRAGGEAAFRFQWSVNAIAVFMLLFLAGSRVGAGLRGIRTSGLTPGDRFLVAGLGYALIALKSGLARSDMYHLVPPVLGLVLAYTVPVPFAVFRSTATQRRLAFAAIALIAVTYGPGMAGTGRLWAQGLVLGARDVLTGRPPGGVAPDPARTVTIGRERAAFNPAAIALGEYLAEPERGDAPVVFYERTWGLDKVVGVAKPIGVYAIDDYLASDAAGDSIRAFLEARPKALVVIHQTSWDYLLDPASAAPYGSMFWFGPTRGRLARFLERWSSSHFGTSVVEERVLKRNRWARTVGEFVKASYAPAATFGVWIVLARIGEPVGSGRPAEGPRQ